MVASSDRSGLAVLKESEVRETARLRNLILASLPPQEYKRLAPHLQIVPLRAGQVLRAAHEAVKFAYFPLSGVISVAMTMQDGSSVEICMIGREGFVGVPVLLGMNTASFAVTVQMDGEAMRIEAEVLRRILPISPRLSARLRRWLQVHISEIAQYAACNSLHSIRQRLSRWLLLSHTRAGCQTLPITHDELAQVLGCRRSSITAAATSLQRAGTINYSRGRIRVVNAAGLVEAACECYESIQHYINQKI
jgi:CRP-like cAMP-binding protein